MAKHFITIEEAKDDLLACATFLAEDIKSADGHAEAMKSIVQRYIEEGNVDLAAELSDTVDDPFTRDRLLTAVAEKCAALDDDEYAFQLVEAIEDNGLKDAALERIAIQMSAREDFDKALETIESLRHPENALAVVAVHSFEKGNFAKFSEAVKKIEYPTPKAVALQNIALINLQKGEKAKALGMLEKALDAAFDIDFTEEQIRMVTDIGNLFIEAERRDRAIETFDRIKAVAVALENVHRDFLLGNIALGFFRAGSVDLADRTLDLVADKTQLASCLLGFSREYWDRDEKDDAYETLDESYQVLKSQHERETRDSRSKFGLWRTVAVQFAQFDKADRSIEIAQELADENEQNTALAQIAQVLASKGNDDLTHQAIRAIGQDSSRALALIGVSDAKQRLEKNDEAMEFLNEAASLAETVPQLAARSEVFNELAKRFLILGDQEKARTVSHENLETIAVIRDDSSRAVCLASLADFYSQADFTLDETEKKYLVTMIKHAEM